MVLRSGKVRKAKVMCRRAARRPRVAGGPSGRGPLPTAQSASQTLGGLTWHLVRKFFLLSFSMQKGAGKVQRVSTSEFCGLIACLVPALEFTCNSSGKTFVMFLGGGVHFRKVLSPAVSLNSEGRKTFLKSGVHVKSELNLGY